MKLHELRVALNNMVIELNVSPNAEVLITVPGGMLLDIHHISVITRNGKDVPVLWVKR